MRLISMHLSGLTQFSGREARKDFWPWVGITVAFYMVAFMTISIAVIAGSQTEAADGPVLPIVDLMIANAGIALVCIGLLAAAVTRRLHDCNRGGLFGLMPLPFLFASFAFMSNLADEQAEDEAVLLMMVFNNMIYIVFLLVLVVLCVQPGTKGDNRFGPPPT